MEKSTHTKEYDVLLAALIAARKSAQLSQRKLAARLGTPHSWVAKVENGERRIDLVEFCWFLRACEKDAPRAVGEVARSIMEVRIRSERKRGRMS